MNKSGEVDLRSLLQLAVGGRALVTPAPSESVLEQAVRLRSHGFELKHFADSDDRQWYTARLLLAAYTFMVDPPRMGGWDSAFARHASASKVAVAWTRDSASRYRQPYPGLY